jgi:hypothetical protein
MAWTFGPFAAQTCSAQDVYSFGGSGGSASASTTIPLNRLYYRPSVRQSMPDRTRTELQTEPLEDEPIGPPDGEGPYWTMCVRACDGFYFPIRHYAFQRHFKDDSKKCTAACGNEARLFYFPSRTGSAQTMVDLSGRKYADMPNAFAYKTALKPGCGCHPAPWSAEAAARHRLYAQAEDTKARDAKIGSESAASVAPRDTASAIQNSTPDRSSARSAIAERSGETRKRARDVMREDVQRTTYKSRTGWSIFSR